MSQHEPIPPIPEDHLIRYNVVQKYVGGTSEWEYEAADNGQFLFAASAQERIAKLTADRDTLEQDGIEINKSRNEWIERFLKMQKQYIDLQAENTRLKAPVCDEEWRKVHEVGSWLMDFDSECDKAVRKNVNKLIDSRATRTPPQEG